MGPWNVPCGRADPGNLAAAAGPPIHAVAVIEVPLPDSPEYDRD